MIRMHRYARAASGPITNGPGGRDVDLPEEGDWKDKGSCRKYDPDLFFPPPRGAAKQVDQAKAICAGCPVLDDCLQFALDNREMFGVWGATSEKDRAQMLRPADGGVKLSPKEKAQRTLDAGQKACPRCQVVKPLDDYSRQSKNLDGRESTCKACRYELDQRHRRAKRLGLPVERPERVRRGRPDPVAA